MDLLAATNPIGGPLTQSVFRFDPEMPAYNLMNLRLGFLGERWDIALFINNATDERAFLALDQERGTRGRVPDEPAADDRCVQPHPVLRRPTFECGEDSKTRGTAG